MQHQSIITDLFRHQWLIDENYANAVLPALLQSIEANTPLFRLPELVTTNEPKPDALGVVSMSRIHQKPREIQQESILNLVISGPLMKADNCGAMGMASMADKINQAENNPNIIGTILSIDSPGGTVDGIRMLSQAIQNHSKPIYAHLNDSSALSGGYWTAASADKIFASFESDSVGSIGVMYNYTDFSGIFEQRGGKIQAYYSRLSSKKNNIIRELKDGNEKPLLDDLDMTAVQFQNHVKTFRPNVSTTALTGDVYSATDALKLNLIDGIASFSEVVDKIKKHSHDNSMLYV